MHAALLQRCVILLVDDKIRFRWPLVDIVEFLCRHKQQELPSSRPASESYSNKMTCLSLFQAHTAPVPACSFVKFMIWCSTETDFDLSSHNSVEMKYNPICTDTPKSRGRQMFATIWFKSSTLRLVHSRNASKIMQINVQTVLICSKCNKC